MRIVAGISLANLKPRVFDPASPFYLPNLDAVMISYADFARKPKARAAAMDVGLRAFLRVAEHVAIFLDNGSFVLEENARTQVEYEEFVLGARPDWAPIYHDYIPSPSMSRQAQRRRFQKTMAINRECASRDFVPVIHIGRYLPHYLEEVEPLIRSRGCTGVAVGGIVPNLLRAPKALNRSQTLSALLKVRPDLKEYDTHIFGLGGTATAHLGTLLGFDSADSSGWRNRAARGLIQLGGTGDRMVASLGSWRGRVASLREVSVLRRCPCPACNRYGFDGLCASGLEGFCHRATHNLWVLLREAELAVGKLQDGSYEAWYDGHLDNSIYKEWIVELLQRRHELQVAESRSCDAGFHKAV